MGRVSSTAASGSNTSSSAVVNSPAISNITVLAGVEYTVTLPAGTQRFHIKHRKSSKFEIRYAPAAAEYFTNLGGNVYTEEGLAPSTTYTVYITPLKAGTLEVKSWA